MNELPTFVIAGRPNVGKSALFNRLAGERVSIVHHESGVTRDRIERTLERWGRRFRLVDTGGFTPAELASTDRMAAAINRQVEDALAGAAAVILVVDVTVGVTPLDEAVAVMLRRSGLPVRVAANKADNAVRELAEGEFSRWGFPVWPVSALHGLGVDDLLEDLLNGVPVEAEVAAQAEPPVRVAVLGRPNAGKSSFVNRLLRRDRVIVSDVPGTTRDRVEVPFELQGQPYVLVDTAGLRKTRQAKEAVDKFSVIRAHESVRAADVCVLVIDAAVGPADQDKKIAAMILEARRGCVVVVNKWDLMTEATQHEYTTALRRAMPFLASCPVCFISALSGYNIRQCMQAVAAVAGNVRAELPTGPLNRAVSGALAKAAPPASGRRHLKVYYATQIGQKPVTVRLFVNNPDLAPPAYREYLVRAIRTEFGLDGAPIVLSLRAREGTRPHETPGRRTKHR